MVMSFNPMSMGMGMGMSGNSYQSIRARYACGYADNAERPKTAPYPMDAIPEEPKPKYKRCWFDRFMHSMYS